MRYLISAFCFLLSALAVTAQPVMRSGWTTTNNAAAARAALGIYETNAAAYNVTNTFNVTNNTEITNLTGEAAATVTTISNAAFQFSGSGWMLFGMSFDGGQNGWPPRRVEESGIYLSSYDGTDWGADLGYPKFRGVTGVVRDPAMVKVGNRYGLSYTTNAAATYLTTGSQGFPLHYTDYLGYWPHVTNLSFLLGSETSTGSNTMHWSPVLTVWGSNVVMFGSVTTNGPTAFKQRYRVTSTNDFPYGWSEPAELVHTTGYTNIIDLAPFVWTNGAVYAWYKNESGAAMNLGAFSNGTPSGIFTNIATAPLGSLTEGCWMVQLPNGRVRTYMVRYVYGDDYVGYGNGGGGQVLFYAEADTPAGPWVWTAGGNCSVPFYAQSFKPIVLQEPEEIAIASSLTGGGSTMRGIVNIGGFQGRGIGGLSLGGFAFTNPWPAAAITGIETNDFAALNFGDKNRTRGGILAVNDGWLYGYAPSFSSADTNMALGAFAKNTHRWNSNRFELLVPAYGDGSGLSNVTSASVFDMVTVNRPVVTNSSTYTDALSVNLSVGTWKVDYYIIAASSSYAAYGSKVRPYFTGTATATGLTYSRTYAAASAESGYTSMVMHPGTTAPMAHTVGAANLSVVAAGDYVLNVTVAGVFSVQAAQYAAGAAHTLTALANSQLSATKLQ